MLKRLTMPSTEVMREARARGCASASRRPHTLLAEPARRRRGPTRARRSASASARRTPSRRARSRRSRRSTRSSRPRALRVQTSLPAAPRRARRRRPDRRDELRSRTRQAAGTPRYSGDELPTASSAGLAAPVERPRHERRRPARRRRRSPRPCDPPARRFEWEEAKRALFSDERLPLALASARSTSCSRPTTLCSRLSPAEVRHALLRLRGDLCVPTEPPTTGSPPPRTRRQLVADFFERNDEHFSPSHAVAQFVENVGAPDEAAVAAGATGARAKVVTLRSSTICVCVCVCVCVQCQRARLDARARRADAARRAANAYGTVARGAGTRHGQADQGADRYAVAFMDPNGDGIDLSELTRSFRRSRRRNARQLDGERRARACSRKGVVPELRTDPSSAASGVAVAREQAFGDLRRPSALRLFEDGHMAASSGRGSSSSGRRPALGDKAIKVVLRFLDPNDEGCDGIGRSSSSAPLRSRAARRALSSSTSTARPLLRDNARLDEKWIKAGMPPPAHRADIDTMVTKCFDPSGDGMIEFLELYEAVSRARRAKAEEKCTSSPRCCAR